MASTTATKVTTPKGLSNYTIIRGDGKKSKRGKAKYQASIIGTEEALRPFCNTIDDFWKENKPRGAKKPQTLGYRPHTVRSEEVDEEGDPIYEEVPGMLEIYSSTGVAWPDGKKKKIRVYNAKAKQIDVPDDFRIGNESVISISANMDIYDVEGNQGVNLYLEAIKISKFVEYVGGDNFDEDEDGEDGWDGEDFTGESFEKEAKDEEPKSKPRL